MRLFVFPQLGKDAIKNSAIKLPVIGWVKFRQSREIPKGPLLKQVRIVRRASGWYAMLTCLWEWVQENGPCSREWFPCTVVGLSQGSDCDRLYYNCVIHFDNGTEYEIQGIYQWNRYNWRWAS